MKEFNEIEFSLYEKNPIIKKFGFGSIVADPSVLTPENSHDSKWHLFCHTFTGVFHFSSDDGINFIKEGKVISRAMRPDINYIDGVYYLYYERVQPMIVRGPAAIRLCKWFSEIYLIKSMDLKNWSKPKIVIKYDKGYHKCDEGVSISNPFLIKVDDKYRLYYSCGLSYLDDCKFCEPTYISYAESDTPDGKFVSIDVPVMSPNADDALNNKGCGCIKVYKVKDGYIALQNGISMTQDSISKSEIRLLNSVDGKNFTFVKTVVSPTGYGWMAQFVYACALSLYKGKFYIHFNGRDTAHPLKGREHIGLSIQKD